MKISLINPPLKKLKKKRKMSLARRLASLGNFLIKGDIESNSSWPPLGILYLGTILKENGYEVSLLDADAKQLSYKEVIDWVKRENSDVVGFTSITPNFIRGVEIAKEVKTELPDVKVIFGGPQVTFAPNETLTSYPFIDIVVRGEAEDTILGLVKAFEKNKNLRGINGISFRNNGKIIHNPIRKVETNLDKIRFPDRKLLPDIYDNQMGGIRFTTGKYTTIISSRGCPFYCTFCSCAAFRNGICTFRSPENFVDELEVLVSYGYHDIAIIDDNFTADKKRVERICELILERKLDFHWMCEGRVDSSSLKMFTKMKRAGCEIIFLGIESANQRILDFYNKRITPQQSIKAVEIARKAGMDVVGSFMVGAPIETKAEVINTLKLVKKLPMAVPEINPLGIWSPGTILWNKLTRENQSLKKYWNTGFVPVKVGLCEYSYEWLNKMIRKTFIQFMFNTDLIPREIIKSLTDPFRLELVRKMCGLDK